jgi:hypothetical protein
MERPVEAITYVSTGPGAGTSNVTAWGYYYNQKLFTYDTVILVHESTLTQVCGSTFLP